MISLCKLIMCVAFAGKQLGLLLTSGTLGMVIEVGDSSLTVSLVLALSRLLAWLEGRCT